MRIGARRGLLAAFVVVAAALISAVLPLAASAFLPDGRIYEQVTPPNKEGNFLFAQLEQGGLAEANGNGLVYEASGAVQGVSSSGMIQAVVARRTPGQGWSSSSALPMQKGFLSFFYGDQPLLDFTPDFSKVAWLSRYPYSNEEPATTASPGNVQVFENGSNPLDEPAWVAKPQFPGAFPEPGKLTVPLNDGTGNLPAALAGISTDGTTFFTYSGTLLPQDEVRRPHIGEGNSRYAEPVAWGFYEWHDGQLAEAGERPDGTINPYGAVPAAYAGTNDNFSMGGEINDNQVSVDGTKAYFVSPDPISEAGGGRWEGRPQEPIQLYVREILPNGQRKSVLVSHSEMPGEVGKEASEGVAKFANAPGHGTYFFGTGSSYVFGSADGSHAYFASKSRLTPDAPKITKDYIEVSYQANGGTFTLTVQGEGGEGTTTALPFNASATEVQSAIEALSNVGAGEVTVTGGPRSWGNHAGTYEVEIKGKAYTITANGSKLTKEGSEPGEPVAVINEVPAYWYDFDTASGKVMLMKGLEGAHRENSTTGVSPATLTPDGSHALFWAAEGEKEWLEVWTANSEGGSVETALEFPPTAPGVYEWWRGGTLPAEMSRDGNVFMFESASKFPQFNDAGTNIRQVYRYEVSTKTFDCVSCPPPGVDPEMGSWTEGGAETPISEIPVTINDPHAMSEDGKRIFFDTILPEVGSDTNGIRDVYEWDNGHVFLISSGVGVTSAARVGGATLVDASANGGDVFFATEASLVPSDNDQAMDIYDARIPQPGDNPPPSAVPCEGDVCQGPPSVPQLLTPAASAVFNGLGNIPPEATKPTVVPPKKCKSGFALKHGKCVKKPRHKRAKHSRRRKHKKSNRRGK